MNESDKQFAIAANMPLNVRYGLIIVLAIVGFTLQMLVNMILGLLFLIPVMLLCMSKGLDNRPNLQGGSAEWKTATIDEFKKITELFNAADSFKQRSGAFSLSSSKGCGGCFLFCVLIGLGAMILSAIVPAVSESAFDPISRGGSLATLFVLDALALVAPLWLFGSVKTWEPPELRKRMGQLDYIYEQSKQAPDLDFVPNILISKSSKGDVPVECKLTAKIKEAPEDFLGIQIQTSLNSVQGTTYPYTYCVLVAKPEFGMLAKARQLVEMPPRGGFSTGLLATDNEKKEAKFARYYDALIELKQEKDVEIAVVRQNTKGTGYKTSPDEAYRVFTVAYNLAKKVLG